MTSTKFWRPALAGRALKGRWQRSRGGRPRKATSGRNAPRRGAGNIAGGNAPGNGDPPNPTATLKGSQCPVTSKCNVQNADQGLCHGMGGTLSGSGRLLLPGCPWALPTARLPGPFQGALELGSLGSRKDSLPQATPLAGEE